MGGPTRVLFIGGQGRSGSTVVENLLERVPGIVSVGELRFVFSRGLGDNELCRCGRPFRECDHWQQVLRTAFPAGVDRERVQRSVDALNAIARTPQLVRPGLMTPALRAHAEVYGQAFAALYRAVSEHTGAGVVVDSSKYPLHGLFLRTVDDIDLATVLLVRDPRAVAHSWTRRKVRREVHWEYREMRRHPVVRSALVWDVLNWLTRRLDRPGEDFRVQRYEDFVADPLGQLRDIAAFALRVDPAAVDVDESVFAARALTSHTLSGNPGQAGARPVVVRPDDEWRTALSPARQVAVTATTLLPMRRYGYSPRLGG